MVVTLVMTQDGVSCKKCHGNFGKGRFIGKFEDENGEEKSFYGPDLSGLSLSEFKKALVKEAQ